MYLAVSMIRSRPTVRYARQRGFTLIEVLLTLAVLVGMLVVVMPVIEYSIQRIQERQCMERLTADLYLAASEARRRRSNIIISFTPDAAYTIRTQYGALLKSVPIPAGFHIYHNFPVAGFHFTHLGHISRAGTIRLINPDGRERKIVLYMASGRFQIDGGEG